MACIYVLYSLKANKRYVGSSREDVFNERLSEHNKGNVRSTKFGRPWRLIHSENFGTYAESRKREIFLKSGQGRLWIKQNIKWRDA